MFPNGQPPYPQQPYPQQPYPQAPYPQNTFDGQQGQFPQPMPFQQPPYCQVPYPDFSQPQMYPPPQQGYPQGLPQYPPQGFQDYAQMQNYQPMVPPHQNYDQQNYAPQQPYSTQEEEEEEEASEEESEDDEEEDYESDSEWETFRGNPTLFAADPFDPVADAATLRKAMKGFGTDEDALIEVLCRRTSDQRQEIADAFEKAYGKTLQEKIKSETSGNFETLLLALLTPLADFYSKELKEPLSAKKMLVEVLCSLFNGEIDDIKTSYNNMYGQELEAAILGDGDSNFFQTLMIALSRAEKDESDDIDIDAAKEDANTLIEAEDVFEYEGIFEEMLCNRNYDQLRTILREYQILRGKSFLHLIKKSFSGDEKSGMVHIFRCLNNKAEFFAHQLHDAIEGLGTNDQKLIRLVVTRCEIDMMDIKAAFSRLFGKSFKDYIKGDCSGDYKHALYALIGEKRS